MTVKLARPADEDREASAYGSPHMSSFLRDGWYAVAWSEEVGEAPFPVMVCDESIVLLRKADGEISALSGLCPHRFASLAKGLRLDGDRLQCPYHGLEFDAVGQCVGNPHGAVPRTVRLRHYPSVELHTLIWLWVGAEDRADPTLIPDFSLFGDPGRKTLRGRLAMNVNYELITDNLLDLSHVAFVHKGGIGSEVAAQGQHTVVQKDTTVFSDRWCPDGPPPPAWATLFNNYKDNVDHWMNMRWDAPASMWLDIGVAPAGADRSEGITVYNAHFLTPETETSTQYLWAASRDFSLDDEAVDAMVRGPIEYAFSKEDHPMIEDVQRNMRGRTFAEMRPLLLAFDEGAVRARRLLDDMRSGRRRQLTPVAEGPSATLHPKSPKNVTPGGRSGRSDQD